MNRSCHAIPFVLGLLFVASYAAADSVVLLDGRTVAGPITRIANGAVRCGDQTIELQQTRRLIFDDKPHTPPHAARRVYLTDDSLLRVSAVRVGDGRCVIGWAYGEQSAWPLDEVRAVLLTPLTGDRPEPAFTEAIDQPRPDGDRLLVKTDDRLTTVEGALESLGPDQATFIWRDQARTVDRAKVYGLILAGPAAAPDRVGWCLAHLADGSRLWGRSPALAGKTLRITRGERTLCLPAGAVRRLDMRSDRMVFLSDLEPVSIEDEALFTFNGVGRDVSVLGRPLTLGEKIYEKGLGVHAPCRIAYALDGRFDTFAAVIGIDAETHGRGDCVFKVQLDGRTAFERRMRGDDPPQPLRVPLGKAKRLELVVEYGEDLDLSDHADWADARLVREP